MKVLFTTHPGLGHLHPLVPVAQALQEAGHEVAFACAQSFCPRVAALGFRCFPAGLDWLESEVERTFPELQEVPLEQQDSTWMVTNVFADIAAHRMVPDLLAICREWQPDLIVRNDFEFAACIVGSVLDIPYATIAIETFLPNYMWEPHLADHLAYLRSAYGLSPYPALEMLHPYLYLSFLPPSFQFPQFRLPDVAHTLRSPAFDHSGSENLPAWVADLPDRPTVYATLGTVFNHAPQVFRSIIAGLRDMAVNVIITVGSHQDPAQFGPQPDHIHIERYIPQSLLLPHCAMAITHCGFQTTLSVLNHSLPMLAVPIGATDPLRAIRCVALGSGLAVLSDLLKTQISDPMWQTILEQYRMSWVPMDPVAIHDAVHALLFDPIYRQNAQRVYQEMQGLPGLDHAVELLTSLATERSPIRNSASTVMSK